MTRNQPLWKVLPEFVAKHACYERMGLKDLCHLIHGVYSLNDVARLTTEMYLSDMIPAMRPADAFAKMAHREIDRVPIDSARRTYYQYSPDAVPAGHPATDSGRAFQRHDRPLPQVRARLQRAVSRIRNRHPRAW